ncbi:hypothetical protein [Prolixibacter sp. NT017]|uniref:hypothetical protein n=1 Tax=Prolixibacter sp. NT017 TaxID=2652390 RepID=UPI00188F0F3A|nr:hypothetical protein [Prolixibacter sp. NT017]
MEISKRISRYIIVTDFTPSWHANFRLVSHALSFRKFSWVSTQPSPTEGNVAQRLLDGNIEEPS